MLTCAPSSFAALAACGGGQPPTTADLIQTLLHSSSRSSRVKAADALAARLDPVLTRRIVARAGSVERSRTGIALLRDGYIAIYRAQATTYRERAAAIRSLAEIDDRTSANAVAGALLGDTRRHVRVTASAALGKMRKSGPRVADRLIRERRRSSTPLPQVERALVLIGPLVVARLLPLIPEDWALRIIAELGPRSVGPLRYALASTDFRREFAAACGLLEVQKRHPGAVRSATPRMVSVMIRKVHSDDYVQSTRAAGVLTLVGPPAMDALVHEHREWARTHDLDLEPDPADQAFLLMAQAYPKAVTPLIAALRRGDYKFIAELEAEYIALGRPDSIKQLITSLNTHGNEIMALDFLNSGNAELVQGARDWAAAHALKVEGTPPSEGEWGSARGEPFESPCRY